MSYLISIKSALSNPVNQIAFFLFLLLCFYMPQIYMPYDKEAFLAWCQYAFDNGLTKVYHIEHPVMNYPPLMCYMVWVFAKFQGSHFLIERYFYFFKTYGLIFDFAGALFVITLVKDRAREILILLLMVANPIFIYNSYMWGQLDSILACLTFATMFFLLKNNLPAAGVMFLLIINLKPQAIIFVPPLMLLMFYQLAENGNWKGVTKSVLLCVLLELLLLLPFILTGELKSVVNVYTHAVGFYPKVSIAAFNVWVFLLGKNCFELSDTLKWCGLSYKQVGLALFCLGSFMALLPLFAATASKYFKSLKYRANTEIILLGFALIPLLFFFCNTEMHERYSHPAILFVAAYSFVSRRYYLLLLFCLAYFCNLEPRLYAMGFPNYSVFIFDPYFVASLFTLLIVSLYYFLYKEFYSIQKQLQ